MKKIILWMVVAMIMLNSVNAFGFKLNIFGYDVTYSPKTEQQIINNVEPQQNLRGKTSSISPYITQINQENANIPMTQGNVYTTYSTPSNNPVQTHIFDNEINYLNNVKETQLILKELNYQNVGIIDEDTGNYYTLIVNNEGLITAVYINKINPEVEFKASFNKVKMLIQQGNYNALKQEIKVPFKVKLKLFWMWI